MGDRHFRACSPTHLRTLLASQLQDLYCFLLLLHLQHLAQWLEYSRCSVSVCQANEWVMSKQTDPEISSAFVPCFLPLQIGCTAVAVSPSLLFPPIILLFLGTWAPLVLLLPGSPASLCQRTSHRLVEQLWLCPIYPIPATLNQWLRGIGYQLIKSLIPDGDTSVWPMLCQHYPPRDLAWDHSLVCSWSLPRPVSPPYRTRGILGILPNESLSLE